MPAPSFTYTLTNSTTADASQVMQNFNDILNGVSDGSKDLSINALTCASTATFNGNVVVGNASSDTLTVTASLASHLVPSADATYDLGSTTIGFRALYLGGNSNYAKVIASGSTSADWTLTLPTGAGTAGYGLQTNGSGVTSWVPLCTAYVAKSADYTILDTDGYRYIGVATSSSDITITLPTAADNTGRVITVFKTDAQSGVAPTGGSLILDGEGAETIDGAASWTVYGQYARMSVCSNGTSWFFVEPLIDSGSWTPVLKEGTNNLTVSSQTGTYHRVGRQCWIDANCTNITDPGAASGAISITGLPFASALSAGISLRDTNKITAPANCLFLVPQVDGSGSTTIGFYWFKTGDFAPLAMAGTDITTGGNSADIMCSGVYMTSAA